MQQSGPQPDLDIWWRHPHLQNGAHAEKHEGRSVPGSLLRLEASFPHTTLRAVTLDGGAKVQVTGQVTGHRLQVRSQATDQVTGHKKQ